MDKSIVLKTTIKLLVKNPKIMLKSKTWPGSSSDGLVHPVLMAWFIRSNDLVHSFPGGSQVRCNVHLERRACA